ncbi:eukaryotic translation initiation factor 4E-binding protein 1-like [Takifugu rubripes]|uniref:Eukaryotic translation initiation factor 4E-binding protein 1 n=1 Tax=Takifugu flavidus TaxID=433684 RepID=A0A5C6N3Y7_9TELE|nr:eukaryotic translation initiation factor 4E-binding protein 1-like [Takifugu rubripes]XP_056888660.1 eukaryotic translation initiation factor 4E-binding protein 1-like [Takifugu flavidus]TWW60437.1 Eukaryotic translation initiation factor 4E-binding protein 1 [Takifugu flavidus]|eukprot:XP_011613999.1 PREDICTED: eukaryotic translation initiation factor 4E-binding protein 1-like [Takifugu rubripes]
MSSDNLKTTAKAIPTIHEAVHTPADYSATPGETLFSTTPGGTRIIYDRKFLLDCRGSPLARTPLHYLPTIPGVTSPCSSTEKAQNGEALNNIGVPEGSMTGGEESQFELDV